MAERPKGYGMTAELADKVKSLVVSRLRLPFCTVYMHVRNSPNLQKAAKYDKELDLKARQWLEEVAGEPFPTGLEPDSNTFHEALKDGVYLCKVINALQPGSVPKVNQSKMAFKMVS